MSGLEHLWWSSSVVIVLLFHSILVVKQSLIEIYETVNK